MLSAFDFADYRDYLQAWIRSQPKEGRGAQLRLAEAIRISSSLVSLILKEEKEMTIEQAHEFCEWVGMSEREGEYFILLVEISRAGTQGLRNRYLRKKKELLEQSKKISKRVPKDMELNDETRAVYYSNWLYTAVRNLSALEENRDVYTIADRLNTPVATIVRVVEFLLANGLCIEKNGRLTYGPALTHLEGESPFAQRHHQNWRLRGFEQMPKNNPEDLYYTCPMSLSVKDAERIRSLLPTVIEDILKIVKPSPSEKVYCINIDWFEW